MGARAAVAADQLYRHDRSTPVFRPLYRPLLRIFLSLSLSFSLSLSLSLSLSFSRCCVGFALFFVPFRPFRLPGPLFLGRESIDPAGRGTRTSGASSPMKHFYGHPSFGKFRNKGRNNGSYLPSPNRDQDYLLLVASRRSQLFFAFYTSPLSVQSSLFFLSTLRCLVSNLSTEICVFITR